MKPLTKKLPQLILWQNSSVVSSKWVKFCGVHLWQRQSTGYCTGKGLSQELKNGGLVLWCFKTGQKSGLNHTMHTVQLLLETMQTELKKAYTQYNCIKQDPNSCNTWIGQLIEVQVQSSGQTKESLWKQVQSWKWIHLMAHQVKFVLGKVAVLSH